MTIVIDVLGRIQLQCVVYTIGRNENRKNLRGNRQTGSFVEIRRHWCYNNNNNNDNNNNVKNRQYRLRSTVKSHTGEDGSIYSLPICVPFGKLQTRIMGCAVNVLRSQNNLLLLSAFVHFFYKFNVKRNTNCVSYYNIMYLVSFIL